jgi:hypothetical protein
MPSSQRANSFTSPAFRTSSPHCPPLQFRRRCNRRHPTTPRLPHTIPAGRRETLVAGHLFIPQKLVRKKRMPLLVHFHGAAWVAETAAGKDGRWAVISVETGEGAEVYARQFSDHALFGKLLNRRIRPPPGEV